MQNPENPENNSALGIKRQQILDYMRRAAPFDGWSEQALAKAAAQAQAAEELPLAFPEGIGDLLQFWTEQDNQRLATVWQQIDPPPDRIRDKVRFLVKTRIELMAPYREAARRAAATLALPGYAPRATRLSWSIADCIWRLLGDKSTDFNYYSKRTILSGVYLTTLQQWFAQANTEDDETVWVFLDERIENVMQFEKLKATSRKYVPDTGKILTHLGRMRFNSKL
ncbi:MAG: COQ9 family protein [bacterium]